jgi:hypothetical protein
MIFLRPFIFVVFTVFLAALGTVYVYQFDQIHIKPYQLSLAVGLFLFFTKAYRPKVLEFSTPVTKALGFFVLAAVLSIHNAAFPFLTVKQLGLLLVYGAIFFLIANVCRDERKLVLLHKTIIFACFFVTAYGLILYILLNLPGMEKVDGYYFTRPASFFAEPNEFGFYLTFAFGYLCVEGFSGRPIVSRAIFYPTILLSYVLLVPNMSRGSWIGWFVVLLAVLLLLQITGINRLTWKKITLLVLCIPLSFFVILFSVSRLTPTQGSKTVADVVLSRCAVLHVLESSRARLFKQRSGSEMTSREKLSIAFDPTISIRYNQIQAAGRSVLRHPFVGLGFGNAFTVIEDGRALSNDNAVRLIPKIRVATSSNFLFDIVAETGFLGLISFLFFLIFLIRKGIKSIKKAPSVTVQIIYIGAFASCIGMIINGMSYPLVMLPFFWISAGILETRCFSGEGKML